MLPLWPDDAPAQYPVELHFIGGPSCGRKFVYWSGDLTRGQALKCKRDGHIYESEPWEGELVLAMRDRGYVGPV